MSNKHLTLYKTVHLPKEKTLLIHYGVQETGSWIYSLCHCGYRGVCDDNWTIMIPNHQHPQHTDARPEQRMYVAQGGRKGIFAWNYGGIKGVASEDFDADHSYLVQLTVQKDCSTIPPSGGGGQPTGTKKTGVNTGQTGKGVRTVTSRTGPTKPPFGGGPPVPAPIPPIGPPIIVGGPGTNYNPTIVPGTTTTAAPNHRSPIGVTLPPSESVIVGSIREMSNTTAPISNVLYPNTKINTVEGITQRGLNYRMKDLNPVTSEAVEQQSRLTNPPGVDPTEAPGDAINKRGFHQVRGSWVFGDGKEFAKGGGPGPENGLGNTVIDMASFYSSQKLRMGREHSPNGPNQNNPGVNFPVVSSLPLRPGFANEEPKVLDQEHQDLILNANSASLGADAPIQSRYAADRPAPTTPQTIDSGENGETILVVSSLTVQQGSKLNVSTMFIPSTPGVIIPVRGSLIATDSMEQSYTISEMDLTSSSTAQPAGIAADIRTDLFALGRLSLTAIFRDTNQKTVGIATQETSIIQPSAEQSDTEIDTYRDIKRDDLSEGLRNLTQVATTPIDLIIPAKGERTLILNRPNAPSDAINTLLTNMSIVVAPKVIGVVDTGMHAAMYDMHTTSDYTRIGDSAVSTGPGSTQAAKRYGTRFLYTSTPTLVNKKPVFEDEHIIGHVPVSAEASQILLNISKFGAAAYQDNDVQVFIHRDLELWNTTRNTVPVRTGGTVTLSYDTPFSSETVKLLVIGFQPDSVPETIDFHAAETDTNGTATFRNVTATREQYISLLSYPYRVGKDEFYTEKVDG